MRITIGHVLMGATAGLVAARLFGTPDQKEFFEKSAKGLITEAQTWISLFKSGDEQGVAEKSDPVDSLSEFSAVANSDASNTEPAAPADVQPAVEPVVESAPAVAAVSPLPAAKVSSPGKIHASKRRSTKRRKAVVKEKPKVSVPVVDSLVGNYVSVELVSGQKVQGVLEQRTSKEVKIQLPGMGPFSYPVQNVKSIKLAQ